MLEAYARAVVEERRGPSNLRALATYLRWEHGRGMEPAYILVALSNAHTEQTKARQANGGAVRSFVKVLRSFALGNKKPPIVPARSPGALRGPEKDRTAVPEGALAGRVRPLRLLEHPPAQDRLTRREHLIDPRDGRMVRGGPQ
jgi:hypothetical protein